MLTEPDDSKQGGNRKYLEEPAEWCGYDPTLFEVLAKASASPQLSNLQRIEADGIVHGATFFNEFVPDDGTKRGSFHTRCLNALAGRDLVFFDPDNGLDIKKRPFSSTSTLGIFVERSSRDWFPATAS